MFGHRYFGMRYFGPNYFGPDVDAGGPDPDPVVVKGVRGFIVSMGGLLAR